MPACLACVFRKTITTEDTESTEESLWIFLCVTQCPLWWKLLKIPGEGARIHVIWAEKRDWFCIILSSFIHPHRSCAIAKS
jgi:hypothetical protein